MLKTFGWILALIFAACLCFEVYRRHELHQDLQDSHVTLMVIERLYMETVMDNDSLRRQMRKADAGRRRMYNRKELMDSLAALKIIYLRNAINACAAGHRDRANEWIKKANKVSILTK